MTVAITMLKAMVGIQSISSSSSSLIIPNKLLTLLLLIVWFTPNTQQWMGQYNPALAQPVAKTFIGWVDRSWQKLQWQPNLLWSIICTMLTVYSLLTLSKASEFLYFEF